VFLLNELSASQIFRPTNFHQLDFRHGITKSRDSFLSKTPVNLRNEIEQSKEKVMSNSSHRKNVINNRVQKALVREYHQAIEEGESRTDPLVVARWFSLDGEEYFGLEINPDRPSVVYGCVRLPSDMGGGWEFSTFWVIREEGNPYSEGQSLEEQTIPIRINGLPFDFPRWELDLYWEPVGLAELTKRIENGESRWAA
jgi:hypothetical protein